MRGADGIMYGLAEIGQLEFISELSRGFSVRGFHDIGRFGVK